MPIYEFECRACGRFFQRLILKRDEEAVVACPECDGSDLKRLISRVAYHVSEQDRLSAFDPRTAKGDGFYLDTRNIGLNAKKKAKQMGVDLGEAFESKLDRLRTDPSSVVKESE